jgi:hypothetical protein
VGIIFLFALLAPSIGQRQDGRETGSYHHMRFARRFCPSCMHKRLKGN